MRPVISRLQKEFAHDDSKSFLVLDLVADAMPRGADLIISRQVLQHMEVADVLATLHSWSRSGAKYLLMTYVRCPCGWQRQGRVFGPLPHIVSPSMTNGSPVRSFGHKHAGRGHYGFNFEPLVSEGAMVTYVGVCPWRVLTDPPASSSPAIVVPPPKKHPPPPTCQIRL